MQMRWLKERFTGYAAFRNHDRGIWLFGRLYWDMDPYNFLALRVKSDGRRYTVNVQTDSIVDTDIHQHRLYTHHHRLPRSSSPTSSAQGPAGLADFPPPSPAVSSTVGSHTTTPNPDSTGWETIMIKWSDFVRTNLGLVVEPQTSLVKQRVKSIGIGLTDRVEGPYELLIHRVWATNGLSEAEMEEERRICGANALNASAPEVGNEPSLVDQESKGVDRFKGLKELGKEWEK